MKVIFSSNTTLRKKENKKPNKPSADEIDFFDFDQPISMEEFLKENQD